MNPSTPTQITAPVKSATTSKVNITAAIMGLLGLLAALGVVPEGVANIETVGGIGTLLSGLIIWFRSRSRAVLATAV